MSLPRKAPAGARWGGVAMGLMVGLVVIVVLEMARRPGRPGGKPSSKPPRYVPVVERLDETRDLRHPVFQVVVEPSLTVSERVSVLRELGEDLSGDEMDALLDYLLAAELDGATIGQFSYLINEVLNALHRQPVQPSRMAQVAVALAEDDARPDLVRDYALQHLRLVWGRAHDDVASRKLVEESLWRAVDEGHASRAATSLITLHNLGSAGGPVSQDPAGEARAISTSDIAEATLGILGKEGQSPTMRMAALRVVHERELSNGLSHCRAIAFDDEEAIALRLCAIAGLGRLGGKGERERLAELAAEPLMRLAAESAIKALQDMES